MKRGQFVKLISASIVAGVVAPVCVLPKSDSHNKLSALQGGVSVYEYKGILVQYGTGGECEWVPIEEAEFKYQVNQDGKMFIRYFGEKWTQTKPQKK